jgi:hypothetical protein
MGLIMKTIITSTEALKINQVKQLELINQKVTTKKSQLKSQATKLKPEPLKTE